MGDHIRHVIAKIDECQWNRRVVGMQIVHQPVERWNKATRAGVHAGSCRCADGWKDGWMDGWAECRMVRQNGIAIGTGVSSDEEHFLTSFHGVKCHSGRQV